MFFFFYAGAAPEVRKVLQKEVERCPRCGSPASLVEYDTVFRVFFIPVYRSKGKNPAIFCENCKFLMPLSDQRTLQEPPVEELPRPEGHLDVTTRCWSCSRPLRGEYKYCPFCGSPQDTKI